MKWSRVLGLSLAITSLLFLPFLYDYFLVVKGIFHLQLMKVFNPYSLVIAVQVLPLLFFLLAAFLWQRNGSALPREIALKADGMAQSLIQHVLPLALLGVSIVWIAGWLPHYLTWPWWMDVEHFALSALMWENGTKPYKDLFDFNFPGPIYFFWFMGKLTGWGRPLPINLIDALLVVSCGPILTFWSRRKLNSVIPGLLGFLLILRYYTSLDYSKVMQRDWHVVYIYLLTIVILQTSNYSRRYLLAGLLFALALSIRPYSVLFFPGVLTVIYFDAGMQKQRKRHLAEFILSSVLCSIIAFVPLMTSGIFDDFVASFLNELRHGKYTPENRRSVLTHMYLQTNTKIIFSAIAGVVLSLITIYKNQKKNEIGIFMPWAVSCLTFLFYKPLCPVRHAYTEIPMELVACTCCGISFHYMRQVKWIRPSTLLAFLVLWFISYFPGMPTYFHLKASGESLQAIANHQMPAKAPPGCKTLLGNCDDPNMVYCWQDYTRVIRYIREELKPEVKVANFLRARPYPTINSPTGRQTIWPCGEGLLWLNSVNQFLEPHYIRTLEKNEPVVIIWRDEGVKFATKNTYEQIEYRVRYYFEPFESFGSISIWKRKNLKREDYIHSQPEDEMKFVDNR